MSAVILDIVLTADHKRISTEHLCHVAAALNVTTTGQRNLRFKVKAAIRKHLLTVESATVESRSTASVADLFNSFEAHRRPTLLSIDHIPLAEKAAVDQIRIEITKHVLSGGYVPDCVDVCNEWRVNTLDPDLQVHILTAIHGTLFSAQISLATYVMKDKNPKFLDTKIYHVNVDKLTILDKGDGKTWDPSVPVLLEKVQTPTMPRTKRARDPAVDRSFNNLSPSKKGRST
ncbi:hypothetical protein C8J57DRAFT_1540697 [Mycena rebaudengoi]|nr:hypothetical protein C8J57DRAFT_1540697 [Mycena rebaudengoi]